MTTTLVRAFVKLVIAVWSAGVFAQQVDPFLGVVKQSTPTSCGPAAAATYLQRMGINVGEHEITHILESRLYPAKRQLRDAHALKPVDADRAAKLLAARQDLRAAGYLDASVTRMTRNLDERGAIPLGQGTGVSREDLAVALRALGLKAEWRALNVKRLRESATSIEIQGVVLLEETDHYVAVHAVRQDLAGAIVEVSDPDPEVGGNVTEPLARFLRLADPRETGRIPLLVVGAVPGQVQKIPATFPLFRSRDDVAEHQSLVSAETNLNGDAYRLSWVTRRSLGLHIDAGELNLSGLSATGSFGGMRAKGSISGSLGRTMRASVVELSVASPNAARSAGVVIQKFHDAQNNTISRDISAIGEVSLGTADARLRLDVGRSSESDGTIRHDRAGLTILDPRRDTSLTLRLSRSHDAERTMSVEISYRVSW